MKLTLRTLIAFLDGTISDDDAATLRKKIKESEAIRELIERIRQIVSQPQLMALRVTGKGLGANPNYSSEYLDSTLDPEQVAEFEKLAIGSDMLLAEIAESHQILANLDQADDVVSGRLQNRLCKTIESIYKADSEEPEIFPVVEDHSSIQEEYEDIESPKKKAPKTPLAPSEFQSTIDAKTSSSVASTPSINAPPVIQSMSRQQAELAAEGSTGGLHMDPTPVTSKVEQNTRSSRGSTGQPDSMDVGVNTHTRLLPILLATACMTGLLSLIIISFLKQDNQETANNDPENEVEQLGDKNPKEQENPQRKNSSGTEPPEDSTGQAIAGTIGDPELNKKTEGIRHDGSSKKENQANSKDAKPSHIPGSNSTSPLIPEKVSGKKNKKEKKAINLFEDKDYDNTKKEPTGNPPSTGNAAIKKGKKEPLARPRPSNNLTDSKELMAKAVSLVNGPVIGVLKSASEPTVRRTNLTGAKWISLAPEQGIHINDRVAALPGCRPKIEIMQSIRVQLYGFCEIEARENAGKVLPRLLVHKGIVTLENMKGPQTTIDVSVQGTNYQVTFVDPKSKITIASHSTPPGKSTPRIIQMVAEKGRGIVKVDGEVLHLEPMGMLQITGADRQTRTFRTKPGFMTQKIDRLTESAKETFFELSLENPVFEIALSKSLADHRVYLRKFSCNSAVTLGRFPEFIYFLGNEQNKSFWRESVLSFRQHLLSDAELFAQGHVFFEKLSDSDPPNAKQGKLFFQMLTTTTDEELETGMAELLVGSLESPNLVVRVGGIQSLFALTGKDNFFGAEAKEEKRRKGVKAWKKSLQTGQIRVLTPFKTVQFE